MLKLVSLLAATVSVLLTVPLVFRQAATVFPNGTQPDQAVHAELQTIRDEIASLQMAVRVAQVPAGQASAPMPPDELALQVAQTKALAQSLSDRLSKIEGAILTTPAKALEIPLIQRDIESLRSSQVSALAAMKDGIDRLYDINKWLLGAMAVSVVTLALSNFLRPKEGGSRGEA